MIIGALNKNIIKAHMQGVFANSNGDIREILMLAMISINFYLIHIRMPGLEENKNGI